MKSGLLGAGLFAFCAAFFLAPVTAQPVDDGSIAGIIGQRGTPRADAPQYDGLANDELRGTFPAISKVTSRSFGGAGLTTRGAKEAQIYKDVAPSVVLILLKDSLGTGTLINDKGEILTNWHVIKGAKEVGVLFKPADGQKPNEKDVVRGTVIRYDAVADLALVKVDPPAGRTPVKFGNAKDLMIGLDVFAIGHPDGIDWTYTKGIISQIRPAYNWTYTDKTKHTADLIQTQTPINPGNSGGPLLSDSGTLVGVNSFVSDGEGLNFAVSISEVNAFLARSGNRETTLLEEQPRVAAKDCKVKVIESGRTEKDDGDYEAVDLNCDGKIDAAHYTPDDKKKAIILVADTNGDEERDAWIYDNDRDGKWDVSFWETKFDGKVDVVGYHPDGKLKPTYFENFEDFKARVDAERQARKQ
jgi:S1-C subfamily serine protease